MKRIIPLLFSLLAVAPAYGQVQWYPESCTQSPCAMYEGRIYPGLHEDVFNDGAVFRGFQADNGITYGSDMGEFSIYPFGALEPVWTNWMPSTFEWGNSRFMLFGITQSVTSPYAETGHLLVRISDYERAYPDARRDTWTRLVHNGYIVIGRQSVRDTLYMADALTVFESDKGIEECGFAVEWRANSGGQLCWPDHLVLFQPNEGYTFGIYTVPYEQTQFPISFVSIESKDGPEEVSLIQNYPNPFNPVTTVTYTLDRSGPVDLTVYDLTGRLVSVLVDGVHPPGRHAVQFDATGLPTGTYVYRLRAGTETLTRIMTLVR